MSFARKLSIEPNIETIFLSWKVEKKMVWSEVEMELNELRGKKEIGCQLMLVAWILGNPKHIGNSKYLLRRKNLFLISSNQLVFKHDNI